MNKEKEEMLEKLREVKQTAEEDLIKNSNTEDKSEVVQNVKHYGNIELTRRDNGEKDSFELYKVEIYDYNTDKIKTKIYLDGHEVDLLELMQEYEEDITDTLSNKLNEKKQEDLNKDKEISDEGKEEKEKIYNLNELEEEKSKEEQENVKEDEEEKENSKNDLTGKKPTHVLQTVDVNSTYIDNWTTVSRGFNLPPEVKQIAIASPIQKDDYIISSSMTMYMLDSKGNIIENIHGKTIKDYFELDDATGNNPMYDDNTKYELEGYAEKNKGQTMMRFKSKESSSLYLSIEQKEMGGYHEVYAGGRTLDGNDPVEIQLETRNEEIQTSLELQEEFGITYKGKYEKDDKDKEADLAEKDECKPEKISLKNADGDKSTVALRCKHIPGTDMTWGELSEDTGEGIEILQERFGRELINGREPEVIVKDIERDYEMINRSQEHKHY